ncbi:MAG: glycosyltransferase family 1 protein [Desulfobulbaceae bacterium]|nr:MAG: glycosyltransferase family 1 protein [Desulfobulbaceae bacterium]
MEPQPSPIRMSVLVSTLAANSAELFLRDLLLTINRSLIDPKLIFLKQPGVVGEELIQKGFEAVSDLSPSRFSSKATQRIGQALQEQDSELLFLINHLNSMVYGIPAGRKQNIPIINWCNMTDQPNQVNRVDMACRRLLHFKVDTIIAAARGHRDYLIRYEGLPAEKIKVIYNGISPKHIRATQSPEETRRMLEIPRDAKVISQLASLRPDKAHEIMLEAMVYIKNKIPESLLLIVGDGEQRNFLEEQARKFGLENHCRFLGERQDIGNILAITDTVAISSLPHHETLSIEAIESLFSGTPVVSTDVGFMNEIILQEITGLLVPPRSPEQLALATIKILRDNRLRAKMSLKAKEHIEQLCNTEVMTRKFEQEIITLSDREQLKT